MSELDTARAIVMGMVDPAILLDADLKLVAYNGRFLDVTGLRRRAFETRLAEVSSPIELVADIAGLEREHAQTSLKIRKSIMLAEVPAKNGAGDAITVHITFIPVLGADGAPIGLIESLRDVSGEARVQGRYHELLAIERLRAEHLEREVEKRTRELTAALEQVTRMSREDPLTGLLNRRAFTEHAEAALKLARRHRRQVAVLVSDLDFFKKVNDTYGHQAGDAVLIDTARVLRKSFRDTDFVARFGGEEFVVLLSETTGGEVEAIGERLRESIERHGHADPIPGVKFPTMSLGMAIFPDHGETLDELVSRADTALYQAKEDGRNRAILFDPGRKSAGAPAPRVENLPRVLVCSAQAGDTYRAALGEGYEVVVEATAAGTMTRVERERFDVILVDLPDVEESIELLRQTIRARPESLRVLIIDTEDVFVEVRGANVARVDCFVLRREGPSNIQSAIDNGLARRELDRQRMLLDNADVRKLYTARMGELDTMISERRLSVAFQPIVDPRTRQVRAYECLARAKHPLFKNPTVLFEAAVQSGNLWRLGRLCREVAMTAAGALPGDAMIFLNLHPGEIDDPELVPWAAALGGAERIVFEITERAAIPDFRRFRSATAGLGSHGFNFAIDDLGAGYASLNAVAMLAPRFIKLDMTMVRGIDASRPKQRLVRRMAEFADDIGIELITEGVETEAEAACVAELGCHLAQGYYFGRPVES